MKKHCEELGLALDELDPEMATFGELLLRRAAGMNSERVPRRIRESLLRSWRTLRVAERCNCGEGACRSYVFNSAIGRSQERNRPPTPAGELAIIADRNGEILRIEALMFDDRAPRSARAYIADGDDWRVVRLAA